jgi:hypothetical protein
MQAICKGISSQNDLLSKNVCFIENVFSNDFQILFYKASSLNLKEIILKP